MPNRAEQDQFYPTPGLKFANLEMNMKKKESLWQLLKRLDEEAGQFNSNLQKANHYFDSAASATNKTWENHEKELHKLIGKVRKSLKDFMKQNEKKPKKHDK